jgi:hypothetical protein
MWAQGLTIGILIVAGALKHSQRQADLANKHEDHSWMEVVSIFWVHFDCTILN